MSNNMLESNNVKVVKKLEEANLLVADTDWTQKVATIRDNRNNIAKFLNITI